MSEMGQSRPSYSTPIPTNVRCYSNSGQTRQRLECPLSANRVISHCGKAADLFAVSDKPPYGTSVPGAGVVHHINSRHACLSRAREKYLWKSSVFALTVSIRP